MSRRRAATALVVLAGLLGAVGSGAAHADAGGGAAAAVRPAAADAPGARAVEIVAGMTVEQQYMTGAGRGGFILMGANVPETESGVQAVTAAIRAGQDPPPLIAIDQEGGDVSRLGWDDLPASSTLKNASAADVAQAFAARGSLVARAGANVNFGIVADTTADTSSFIFGRSLGADPAGAADRVAAAVAAEEPFVASTLKHFPGHGAAPGDSHELIPSTAKPLADWESTDALPFIAGIDAGASLLMFGHLSYTAVDAAPASLSPRWHEIARDDLGFDGVIVTDDLGMLQSTGLAEYADPVANAVAAVAAGNDLVLTIAHSSPDTAAQLASGIADAVDSGAIPADRLQDAAERVMALRLELAASSAVWSPAD